MSNFGKRPHGTPRRRWLKRRRVGISAFALTDRSVPVLIQDLTLTGAKLLGRDLPPPATRVTLKVGDRSATGEVVWAVDDHRGISFNFARR